MTRFDPAGPLRGSPAPARRQVDLPPGGADRGDGGGGDGDRGLPRRRRHPLDPGRGRRAWRRGRGDRTRVAGRAVAAASAASACAAPRPAAIDVGNAGTLLRLLPGWLAGQEGGELDARRRRVDPAPPGRSDRRAAARDGGDARVPRRPPAAAADRGRAAARDRATSCRSPAPRSSPACSSPACSPRARRGSSSRCRAATTPSGCCAAAGAEVERDGDAVVDPAR